MKKIQKLFQKKISVEGNLIVTDIERLATNQNQTKEAFSEKWDNADENDLTEDEDFVLRQKQWFLELYGFSTESELAKFLKGKTILDAGCGIGYKTSWISNLSPESLVVGIDLSNSIYIASKKYSKNKNLYFVKGDIAKTDFKVESFDVIICDQVIMHTENPKLTFDHLTSLIIPGGIFFYYLYAEKALPRELVDDYFRLKTHDLNNQELWDLSSQLTVLGKNLSELDVKVNTPDIPLLGIKGGEYDIQRFIYWNFLKCFYNPNWTKNANDVVNFDWYSPSNAMRFSESEFLELIQKSNFEIIFSHKEEASFSGRIKKQKNE